MNNINHTLPDKRLWDRYYELAKAHFQHRQATAAGPAIPVSLLSNFAATQALWRFLANDRVTMDALIGPLRQFAHQQIGPEDEYVRQELRCLCLVRGRRIKIRNSPCFQGTSGVYAENGDKLLLFP